jgi:hypothetical protein
LSLCREAGLALRWDEAAIANVAQGFSPAKQA